MNAQLVFVSLAAPFTRCLTADWDFSRQLPLHPRRGPGRCFRVSQGSGGVVTDQRFVSCQNARQRFLLLFPPRRLSDGIPPAVESAARRRTGSWGCRWSRRDGGGRRPRRFNFIQQHEGQLKVGQKKQVRREDWCHSLYERQLASQLA